MYSAAHSSLRKKRRSSRFAKPANCEVLWRRTSNSLRISACLKVVKKSAAVFFVKPIVKTLLHLAECAAPVPAIVRCSSLSCCGSSQYLNRGPMQQDLDQMTSVFCVVQV